MSDRAPLTPAGRDALAEFYTRRDALLASGALSCARDQGLRYGNCQACTLDGFLDPVDCQATS